MDDRGLLFIPDISGFTRFITDMEIGHSRIIIGELLEILIDSNQLGLEVSEIEGDAILFYKFGDAPSAQAIYGQVEQMFCAFHRHLQSYEYRRFCQCKACVSAINLSLKVITHYGEFTGYSVKTFQKLIGKDVIVAHQLLKNNIEQHEYWLATQNLVGETKPQTFAEWMQWNTTEKQTESGNIRFHYAQLSELKHKILPEKRPSLELSKKVLVLSTTHEFPVHVKKLFFTTAHLEFRNQWREGVKVLDHEEEHFIPGIGARHRCVLENETIVVYTSGLTYDPQTKIVFSETDEKKSMAVYFILEPVGETKSRLTLEFYLSSRLKKLVFDLVAKKKLIARTQRSMENLEKLLPGIQLPVEF